MPLLLSDSNKKHQSLHSFGLKPPTAPQKEHQEIRHSQVITDPYFWLREKQNPEVIAYIQAENAYTEAVTEPLQPFSGRLYTEMLGRIKQTDLSVPVRRGNFLYYSRTVEGKQYAIECRRQAGPDGKSEGGQEEIILDLNELAIGHQFVGLGTAVVSDDGNLLAYTVDYTGFRQYDLQIKDLRTGKVYPDTTARVTSVVWSAHNTTLLITTEDEITKRSDTLLRYKLGSGNFETVFYEDDELYDIHAAKTRDKQYILLSIESKDTTEVRWMRADHPDGPLDVFLPRQKGHRYYLDHRHGLFYVRTNREAKDFQVVTTTLEAREPENWRPFISHRPGTLIEDIDLFRSFAAVLEKSEALNRLRFYGFESQRWTELSYSEPVFSLSPGHTPEFDSTTYRYSYESFVTPPSVFDYDTQSGESRLLKRQEVLYGYDPGQYESERLWAQARDGVRVPVSIVYRKGFRRDGTAPLFLYGYGSYGIGMTASFSSNRVSLLDRGVAYAIAHIRGGDELGEQWREDGMLMKKKNTFQDFVDCAQWLVNEKWTAPERLVIEGGSAGGLLMGAVVNMRPDLFHAVHLSVPFVDVMNTMMDASLPLTVGEYLEWGDPNEQAAYAYMKSYSPYDNLKKGAYPAILVTTSFNDSQVMYWEPAKYVAKLRTLKTNDTPLLLKTKMEPAGHGGSSGRYDRLRDTAFEYAWILNQLGIDR